MNQQILQELMTITEEEQRILNGEKKIDRNVYMENATNVINSRKLLSKDKKITVRKHTRFVHFPEHTHDYVEAIYMCSGQTTHIINGEAMLLKEGEFLILTQHATQEILPAGLHDIGVNFVIMPEFFEQTLIMLGEEETPLKKWATAEEIAQWAYFLTVTNTFCTGQNILVDGGESINYKFVWKE